MAKENGEVLLLSEHVKVDLQNKKYCRLCAKENGSLSIFNNNSPDLSLCEQILFCTQLEITECDGLPTWLCISCSQLISSYYAFREQCHKAQNELREIFKVFSSLKIEVNSDLDDFDNEMLLEKEAHEDEKESIWDTSKVFAKPENDIVHIKNELSDGNQDCMDKPNANSLVSHLSCKGRDCWAVIFNNVNENDIKQETDDQKSLINLCCVKIKDVPLENSDLIKNFDEVLCNNKIMYRCPSCLKIFSTKPLVKRHRRKNCKALKVKGDLNVISNRKPRKFKEKTSSHLSDEIDDDEYLKPDEDCKMAYKCKHCGRKYKNKTCLVTHKTKLCHAQAKRSFMCDQCGKVFRKRSILIQHMKTHYNKKFSCKICGKRFTRSNHVIIHMRIHDNYKPYVCETCGRPFVKSSDLLRHKRIHSDARNYPCPMCSKSFKRSGDVVSHLRVHTGDKPFKCEPCGKSYSNYSSLKKHKMTICPIKKNSVEIDMIDCKSTLTNQQSSVT